MNLQYAIQLSPDGLAQAFIIEEKPVRTVSERRTGWKISGTFVLRKVG